MIDALRSILSMIGYWLMMPFTVYIDEGNHITWGGLMVVLLLISIALGMLGLYKGKDDN